MQQEISVDKQGAHQAKEEAKPTIRIVGAFNLSVYSPLSGNTSCLLGISVEQITPDKKSAYVKVKLDEVRLKLPTIDAKPIPEQRHWQLQDPLWAFHSLYMDYDGGLIGQLEI